MRGMRILWVVVAVGCGSSHHGLPDAAQREDAARGIDAIASTSDASPTADSALAADAGGASDGALAADAGAALDAGALPDAGVMADAGLMADAGVMADAAVGAITGGPCLSGADGATGYRIRWAGNGPGSTAYPVYEVDGFPDTSRDHAAAYGYQIGFTPTFDDTFLGIGGLVLDSSDFIDLEMSTAGVPHLAKATLAIFGRSFNTTASGSFSWQTFVGTGAAPTNLVANSAPYQWYAADMTAAINAGDATVLLRIKAGPSSGSLIVNRVELCIKE